MAVEVILDREPGPHGAAGIVIFMAGCQARLERPYERREDRDQAMQALAADIAAHWLECDNCKAKQRRKYGRKGGRAIENCQDAQR